MSLPNSNTDLLIKFAATVSVMAEAIGVSDPAAQTDLLLLSACINLHHTRHRSDIPTLECLSRVWNEMRELLDKLQEEGEQGFEEIQRRKTQAKE